MSDEVRKKLCIWDILLYRCLGNVFAGIISGGVYQQMLDKVVMVRKLVAEKGLQLSDQLLTSSLRTPKFFVKEFSYFLMPCHQHGLRINLLVQR